MRGVGGVRYGAGRCAALDMIPALGVILVGLNLLALVSLQLARRWPPAGLGVFLALYLLVQDDWWGVPRVVDRWQRGGAGLLVEPGAPVPDNPDPELRLPWDGPWRRAVSPTGIWLHNTTLWALHHTLGPAAGAWLGEIPTRAEARRLLDEQGQDLLLHLSHGGALRSRGGPERADGVMADGTRVSVGDGWPGHCGEGADGSVHVRVARLDEAAVLVGCGQRTEILTERYPGEAFVRFWGLSEEVASLGGWHRGS